MEIKRPDSEKPLYSFELRDTHWQTFFRVLAHDYKLNLLVDKEVEGTVTASLSNISLEEALETIAESQNLSLIKKKNVIRVGLNLITRIFSLKYIEAKDMLKMSSSSASSFEGAVVENQAGALQEAESESGLSGERRFIHDKHHP